MAKNPLVDLLGRWLRDPELARSEIEVDVVHRGAPNDLRTVVGDEIVAAGAAGIELDDGTFLPLHRVQAVRVRGEPLWGRSTG